MIHEEKFFDLAKEVFVLEFTGSTFQFISIDESMNVKINLPLACQPLISTNYQKTLSISRDCFKVANEMTFFFFFSSCLHSNAIKIRALFISTALWCNYLSLNDCTDISFIPSSTIYLKPQSVITHSGYSNQLDSSPGPEQSRERSNKNPFTLDQF